MIFYLNKQMLHSRYHTKEVSTIMSYEDKTLIVYLDGDYRRFKAVADIYQNFDYDQAHILITSFNDDNELRGTKDLLNSNYDYIDERHILTEYFSTTTYNNAVEIQQILYRLNYGHVIVVTSQYHKFRTRLIFNNVFNGNTKLKFLGVNHHTTLAEYSSEAVKLGLYLLKNYKFFTKDKMLYSKSRYRRVSRLRYQ